MLRSETCSRTAIAKTPEHFLTSGLGLLNSSGHTSLEIQLILKMMKYQESASQQERALVIPKVCYQLHEVSVEGDACNTHSLSRIPPPCHVSMCCEVPHY